MPTNTIICKKTGKPCILCMIGFLPDVTKCPNMQKPKWEATENETPERDQTSPEK